MINRSRILSSSYGRVYRSGDLLWRDEIERERGNGKREAGGGRGAGFPIYTERSRTEQLQDHNTLDSQRSALEYSTVAQKVGKRVPCMISHRVDRPYAAREPLHGPKTQMAEQYVLYLQYLVLFGC